MRALWHQAPAVGMHPQDLEMVQHDAPQNAHLYVNWNLEQALAHVHNPPEPGVLHVGLHPQPFIGNIDNPLVFILHGNPGYSLQDYNDEFNNPGHAAACVQNLLDDTGGFFPLGEASAGTGAAIYWQNAFDDSINMLADLRHIPVRAARDIFKQHVGVIESCPYHSAGAPGEWTDRLPLSKIARRHVSNVFFPVFGTGSHSRLYGGGSAQTFGELGMRLRLQT